MNGGPISGGTISGVASALPSVVPSFVPPLLAWQRGPVPPRPPRGPTPDDLGRKRLPDMRKFFEQSGRPLNNQPRSGADDVSDEQREPRAPQSPTMEQPRVFAPKIETPESILGNYLRDFAQGKLDSIPPGPVSSNVEEEVLKRLLGEVVKKPFKVANWLLGGGSIDPAGRAELPVTEPGGFRPLTPQQQVDPAVRAFFTRLGGAVQAGLIGGPQRPGVTEQGSAENRYDQAIGVLDDADALGVLLRGFVFPSWAADP